MTAHKPGGGSSAPAWELLADVTYQTPNLVDPNDNGYLVATIPAGSVLRVVVVPTVRWVGNGDPTFFVVLAVSSSSASSNLCGYLVETWPSGAADGLFIEPFIITADSPVSVGYASVQCGLYVQAFSDTGVITSGEAKIFGQIGVPS